MLIVAFLALCVSGRGGGGVVPMCLKKGWGSGRCMYTIITYGRKISLSVTVLLRRSKGDMKISDQRGTGCPFFSQLVRTLCSLVEMR